MPPRTIEQIKNRIHEMVKVDPVTGCWMWQGKPTSKGYGYLNMQDKERYAHRVSYLVFNGEIPKGLNVLHQCDTPLCVNPEHLHLGTQQDNVNEMHERNRAKKASGSNSGNSVLVESQIPEIRRLYASKELTARQIAGKFGVSLPAIRSVLSGNTWKRVDGCESNVHREHLGSNHHSATITEETVLLIRSTQSNLHLSYAELARRFNMNYNTVYDIVKLKTWTHI